MKKFKNPTELMWEGYGARGWRDTWVEAYRSETVNGYRFYVYEKDGKKSRQILSGCGHMPFALWFAEIVVGVNVDKEWREHYGIRV